MDKAVPEGLSERAGELWADLAARYPDAFEAEHRELLRLALVALDRADAAAEILGREGLVILGARGQPVPHPAVRIEAASREAFRTGLRQLGLDSYEEER